MGIKQYVNQTTLSKANKQRDFRIFEDLGNYLIQQERPMYANESIPDVDIDNEIFALDSTTIYLSLKLFSLAPGMYSREALKIHTLLDLRDVSIFFIKIS